MVDAHAGKTERITFIRDLLGLPGDPTDQVRYQLFHSIAATVHQSIRFETDRAAMIVQSFSQSHRRFEDFGTVPGLPGLEAGPGKPLRHILPSGKPLDLGWAVGSATFL